MTFKASVKELADNTTTIEGGNPGEVRLTLNFGDAKVYLGHGWLVMSQAEAREYHVGDVLNITVGRE